MTAAEIAELERLCARATGAPWIVGERSGRDVMILGSKKHAYVASVTIEQIGPRALTSWMESEREANAAFIAAAREAVPKLIEERARLRKALEQIASQTDGQWAIEAARAALEETS